MGSTQQTQKLRVENWAPNPLADLKFPSFSHVQWIFWGNPLFSETTTWKLLKKNIKHCQTRVSFPQKDGKESNRSAWPNRHRIGWRETSQEPPFFARITTMVSCNLSILVHQNNRLLVPRWLMDTHTWSWGYCLIGCIRQTYLQWWRSWQLTSIVCVFFFAGP